MAYQPGDWLASAALAQGRKEASEAVERKNRRGQRQRSNSEAENHGRLSVFDMREMRGLNLGQRRYRRQVNDNTLLDLAPALTADDIARVFSPPPWGEKGVQSPLELVTASPHSMAAWEPFRSVDMDSQAKFFRRSLQGEAGRSQGEGRQSSAMKAWRGVERNLRPALRRNYASPFFQEIEEKLVSFVEGDAQDLVLAVGSSYARLLVHGSCQFHGLTSLTVEVPVDSGGPEVETCLLIRKTQKAQLTEICSLPEFLKKIMHK